MKVAAINTCTYGSTGKIMTQIANTVESDGGQAYICVPDGRHNKNKYGGKYIYIGKQFSEDLHLILGRITGMNGCFSLFSTLRFLAQLRGLKIDLIHLHNLHNCYINLPLLFRYIKKHNIPVVWTFHDCWPFTGQCPHFSMAGCDRWKVGCHRCPQYRDYPQSYVDRTKTMYKLKKKWFTGVQNLTIVTPSEWMANLVRQSYLKNYPVKVINNGIDLSIFKPTPGRFREKHGIPKDKYIVLGVALSWGEKKGLDVFIDLSKRLDIKKYQIVLVGTDDSVDKQLPQNIITIHRTHNQTELAEIYTAADVFVNPTRNDNFPTVNIESLACGTPVVTFQTGGSPETLDQTCGSVVSYDDVDAMENEIVRICEKKPFRPEACLARALGFDKDKKFNSYLELYRSVL